MSYELVDTDLYMAYVEALEDQYGVQSFSSPYLRRRLNAPAVLMPPPTLAEQLEQARNIIESCKEDYRLLRKENRQLTEKLASNYLEIKRMRVLIDESQDEINKLRKEKSIWNQVKSVFRSTPKQVPPPNGPYR